jgi:hypothetical protein
LTHDQGVVLGHALRRFADSVSEIAALVFQALALCVHGLQRGTLVSKFGSA